jgi:tetratricopeptide (TPR) repeat protein
LADDKKAPDFDPDKTRVDMPAPRSQNPPQRAPEPDVGEKTVVMTRNPPSPRPPAADPDKTVVSMPRPALQPAAAASEDRTLIRPSSAPQAGPASGYEIVCLSGQSRGRRFELPNDDALIGSNPTCHVVLAGIEGAHAKLRHVGEEFEIQNLGAAGSVVLAGGRRVSSAKIKAGDLIKIGDVAVRFVRTGDVFSSDFDDSEFAASFLTNLLTPERRLYLLGGLGALILVLFLLPTGSPRVVVQTQAPKSNSQADRAKRITAMLDAGDLLLKEGRYFAPTDQPDADNAFSKFNEVLELDPGNERAIAALKKIDTERDQQRRTRDEEKRKQEEARRKALEEKVNTAIRQGDELFDRGQVAEPAGSNALLRYREALSIDPSSTIARDRIQKALQFYVEKGDHARDSGDSWVALENYRKASRAAEGKDPNVEARVRETESHLKAGMAGSDSMLIIYKDENGRTVVLDDADKIPARYRDRAIVIAPSTQNR